MSKSVRDQLLEQGVVKPKAPAPSPPERSRAPVEEKSSPPPFDAPARGVIVESPARPRATRVCEDCGAPLSRTNAHARCPECIADQ
ncbi:MAG TPA: hypothetical protein VFF06_06170 [Polyangia bacterium]|nr:hypothetical protein [Polyangia bacterium]